MGKHPPSVIHRNFSQWHYEKCNPKAYLTDVDRIWVEIRNNKIKGVFDLKYYGSDTPTACEIVVADFFESNGIPYYIAYTDMEFSSWIVYRHKTRNKKYLSEKEMVKWIDENLTEWE